MTNTPITAPAKAATALIAKAVTNADSAGTDVPAIVSAVRMAAPTWPPITPPIVRMTVFMPVATPVSVGRTEVTTIVAIAANASTMPKPRATLPRTICHGWSCQIANEAIPAPVIAIPATRGTRQPSRLPSLPASGPPSRPISAPGSRYRPVVVALTPKP